MLIRIPKIDPADLPRQHDMLKNLDIQLDRALLHLKIRIDRNKELGLSMINNKIIYLYNDMLTYSYLAKLWLIDYQKAQENPITYRTNLLSQSSIRHIETARQLILKFRKSTPPISRHLHYQRLANKAM